MQDKDGVIQYRYIAKRNFKKKIMKTGYEKVDLFELVKNRRDKIGR